MSNWGALVGTAIGAYFGYPQLGAMFGSSVDTAAGNDPQQLSGPDTPAYPVEQVGVTGSSWGNGNAWAALGSGALGYYGQVQTNAANAAMAQRQMDFQASQTSTSYQRAVMDMQAAGLSPMLAYSQGGAGSGSGSTAPMGNSAASALSSALGAATTLQTLDNMRTQNEQGLASIDLTNAQRANTAADTKVKLEQAPNTRASTKLAEANTEIALIDAARRHGTLGYDISSAKSGADEAESSAKSAKYALSKQARESDAWEGSLGPAAARAGMFGDVVSSAGGLARLLTPYRLGGVFGKAAGKVIHP